jgi:hypothetical protein
MIELPGRRSGRIFLSLSFLVPDGKINHDCLATFTFQLTAVSRPGRNLQPTSQHTQTRIVLAVFNSSVSLQELPTTEALLNELCPRIQI